MKLIKLFALAITIGLSLFAAFLIYPEEISHVVANDGKASAIDVSITMEAISVGCALGFSVLLWLGRLRGDKSFKAEIESDRTELKIVFLFISVICFFYSGIELLRIGTWSGVFHIFLGLLAIVYAATILIRGRIGSP